ncbi:MAG: SDR family oxidoreductase [Deltaproteobacteria bacterium]|nr:SDR family oxidoreductase [Deltaproteobacteria bacterium]
MKLKGKVALITGAARAIGRAHALRLARLGADIVINDINLESYKEFQEEMATPTVVEEIRTLGVRAIGIEANVCKKEEVQAMIQKALDELGHIDILINNAGGLAGDVMASIASMVSEEDLRATIDRNLMGTIFCSQAVAEHMKARKWGRIVNTTSQAGLQAQQFGVYSSYGAAKAGVISYTRSLAQELGPFGITVNCISPAYVDTRRLRVLVYDAIPGIEEQLLSQIPLGRMANPDDISKAVEFFVTDLGDYVTGQCLSICGGAIKF